MNLWVVWPVGIFLYALAGAALFWFFERRGIRKNHGPNEVTLSFAVWTLWQKFPLSIMWLWGNANLVTGGLMVHFFWHWCPAGTLSTG